jgi:hypothetical protein
MSKFKDLRDSVERLNLLSECIQNNPERAAEILQHSAGYLKKSADRIADFQTAFYLREEYIAVLLKRIAELESK